MSKDMDKYLNCEKITCADLEKQCKFKVKGLTSDKGLLDTSSLEGAEEQYAKTSKRELNSHL